jgi:hypothetical protein
MGVTLYAIAARRVGDDGERWRGAWHTTRAGAITAAVIYHGSDWAEWFVIVERVVD